MTKDDVSSDGIPGCVSSHQRRRGVGAALSVLVSLALALVLVPSAQAVSWPNEQAMVDSPTGRQTFVAPPTQGTRWEREALIAAHGEYFRSRGFGNVLTWGAKKLNFDPGTTGRWAGCGSSGEQIPGACPNGDTLHLGRVGDALTSSRLLTVIETDGAFIALACGNFSERTVTGDTPTIKGVKFEDLNGDGNRDPGEPGRGGWTIELLNAGQVIATTVTTQTGDYSFDLDANALPITSENFGLREVMKAGWVQSRAPGTVRVPFGSGNDMFAGNDFGNYRPASIVGTKYDDQNINGARDAGEPGLEGWKITLSNGNTQTTGPDGAYRFDGLKPDEFTVSETQQAHYRQTAPATGEGTHTVTLQSGQTSDALLFGNTCLGSSSITVTDISTGGQVDGAQMRLEEIDVPGILDNEPALPRTTTQGSFDDLLPGRYRITVFLPEGVYSADPDTRVVDGRWATVKEIVVSACEDTGLNVKAFTASNGKVTGGMKNVPGGFATAGFQFQTGPKGDARGTLQYNDHADDGPKLHTKDIAAIYVSDDRREAYVWGFIEYEGESSLFRLHLVDEGEPGTLDRFELDVLDRYRAGHDQTIIGGNVQIHK